MFRAVATRLVFASSIASLCLCATGCGSGFAQGTYSGSIVPVKGTVHYKGKLLTKGTVRFEPDAGREAEGTIGPDGTFSLTTFHSGDGAMRGVHRVAVFTPKRKEIPAKFSNFALSGIEVEVSDSQTEYNIELK